MRCEAHVDALRWAEFFLFNIIRPASICCVISAEHKTYPGTMIYLLNEKSIGNIMIVIILTENRDLWPVVACPSLTALGACCTGM